MHSYLQDLYLDCYTSFFTHLYQSYGPCLLQNFVYAQYLDNKWTTNWEPIEPIGRILPNLYMHSSWQDPAWNCYTPFFANFSPELWPLIYAEISFPLNILRTN